MPGTDAFLAVVVLTFFVGTTAGLLLDWPRYYLPTLVLGTLLSAVGVVRGGNILASTMAQQRGTGRAHGPQPLD